MTEKEIKLEGNETYQIDFGNEGGHQLIKATDVEDFVYTNTADWISFSHNGNELEIIVLPNNFEVERTAEIYIKSKYHYGWNATVVIAQSETVYEVLIDGETTVTIDNIKVYNNGELEKLTKSVTVNGATKRCIVKGIKQYITEDTNTYLTTFDNAISANIINTDKDGVYTLQILNYGKATNGNTYYEVTLCHKDNIDTECKVTINYEKETELNTIFIEYDKETDQYKKMDNNISLKFDNSGYCVGGKDTINLLTKDDTVTYTTDETWLYCRLGYDCIKIFVDYYDDGGKDRSGTIKVGDLTINVTQTAKKTKNTSNANEISFSSLEDDFIVDQTPAIELISINGNTIECKTYIYNSKTEEYDNDSMISVLINGTWMHYKTDYNIDTKTHTVTFWGDKNIWLLDRISTIKIMNVEDNYNPIRLMAAQTTNNDNLKIERLTVD